MTITDSTNGTTSDGGGAKSKRAQKRAKQKERQKELKQKEEEFEKRLTSSSSSSSSTSTSLSSSSSESDLRLPSLESDIPNNTPADVTTNGINHHTDASSPSPSSSSSSSSSSVKLETTESSSPLPSSSFSSSTDKVIEYTIEQPQFDESNPMLAEMKQVFEKFAAKRETVYGEDDALDNQEEGADSSQMNKASSSSSSSLTDGTSKPLSKRQLKLQNRLSIAELKQLVSKPEAVELHDANSSDPRLLVSLKSYRNTVAVPQHWSAKRKFLANKRGFEKPPFELPEFIANTGITKIRQSAIDKEKEQNIKSKQRSRMQPKMGKMDIDYQVLHDAFFRYQTKPNLSKHGDIYYEGKEFEVVLTDFKPGVISPALRKALGMSADNELEPPPWLYAMQRYGPPPSWPSLPLPGVNAPIPPGARYGFGKDEWGKPPVDEYGRPLYGDVFGQVRKDNELDMNINKDLWGVLQVEELAEEEEEEAVEGGEAVDEGGVTTESSVNSELDEDDIASGIASGVTSVGMETPQVLQMRKTDGTGTETPDTVAMRSNVPKQLYQVLEEKQTSVGNAMFGSSHTYVLPGAGGSAPPAIAGGTGETSSMSEQERRVAAQKAKARGEVEVALQPEDLENMNAETLKRKYEANLAQAAADKAAALAAARGEDDEEEGGSRKKRKTKDKGFKDFKF